MMQVVGIALVAVLIIVVLRSLNPQIAVLASLATGVIIFILVIGQINSVLQTLENLASRANIDLIYLSTILKIIGVAYISQFGAQICKDAGEGAIGAKVEFAGKILIMVLAVPIVMAILELIVRLIPN